MATSKWNLILKSESARLKREERAAKKKKSPWKQMPFDPLAMTLPKGVTQTKMFDNPGGRRMRRPTAYAMQWFRPGQKSLPRNASPKQRGAMAKATGAAYRGRGKRNPSSSKSNPSGSKLVSLALITGIVVLGYNVAQGLGAPKSPVAMPLARG